MKEDLKEFINNYLKENKEVDQTKFAADLRAKFPLMSMFDICVARSYLKEQLNNEGEKLHE